MKSKIGILLIFGLSLAYTASAQTQAKKTIKPSFTPGEQFEYKNAMAIEVTQDKQPTMRQELAYTMLWNIIGKDVAGKTIIRAEYTSIKQKREDKVKKEITGYDSEMPDQFIKASNTEQDRNLNSYYRQLNEACIGQAFTIYFDEATAGIKVTGIDTMIDKALEKVQIDDSEYKAGFSEGARSTSNNEEMRKALESAFGYLPGKPVGVGDGWTKNKVLEMGTLKLGFLVKSMQSDSIGVVLLSTPVINDEYRMSTSMKGNLAIDAKTGLLIRAATRQEAKSVPGSANVITMVTTEKNELIRKGK